MAMSRLEKTTCSAPADATRGTVACPYVGPAAGWVGGWVGSSVRVSKGAHTPNLQFAPSHTKENQAKNESFSPIGMPAAADRGEGRQERLGGWPRTLFLGHGCVRGWDGSVGLRHVWCGRVREGDVAASLDGREREAQKKRLPKKSDSNSSDSPLKRHFFPFFITFYPQKTTRNPHNPLKTCWQACVVVVHSTALANSSLAWRCILIVYGVCCWQALDSTAPAVTVIATCVV